MKTHKLDEEAVREGVIDNIGGHQFQLGFKRLKKATMISLSIPILTKAGVEGIMTTRMVDDTVLTMSVLGVKDFSRMEGERIAKTLITMFKQAAEDEARRAMRESGR